MTHATFPRVYARKGDGPIFEIIRGMDVADGHLMQLCAQYGSEWRVWREEFGRNAIDAHHTRTKAALPKTPALSREELRAMKQDDYPFEQGGRFSPASPPAPCAPDTPASASPPASA